MAFYLLNNVRGYIMKKLFFILVVIAFSYSLTNAQISKDGWSVGFGAVSPRLFSDITAEDLNFGGRLFIQKNLNEMTAVRVSADYLMFTGKNILPAVSSKFTNNTIKLGLSGVYTMAPCMTFSPYFGVGGSILYYTLENAGNVGNKSYFGELTADIFFGGRMLLDDRWYATVELGQHTTSTDKFDGTIAPGSGGFFGGPLDSYTSLSLGFLYYFEPGEYSTMCDDEAGLSKFDYAKIEEIVKKYAATPTTVNVDYNKIEDIVKKNCGTSTTKERVVTSGNWVLVGVNFEFGKSSLTPESYPVLVNAVQVLLSNPDMKVEIQGHTDNIGSDSFNKKLSEQRAETVKRFLVAKGIATSRLSTVGVGSSNPVADTKTAEGRSLNRRIEFKVLGK